MQVTTLGSSALKVSRVCLGTMTIVGATALEQLREDIDACAGTLSEEVLQKIEALHLRYCNPAP